nr:unnamed protein product [Callosobruchus analis]
MNNARYVRELDFARFHFYDRTGIYDEIKKHNAHVLQTASNIRYRRTIPLLNVYKVVTRVSQTQAVYDILTCREL